MAATRKRNRTTTDPPLPPSSNHDHHTISQYELCREQRIRENRERMGKLGIFDLSLKLKTHNPPSSRRTTPSSANKTPPSLHPSGPTRRSSRLQNVAPVSYSEAPPKKSEIVGSRRIVIEEGSKPEVYTEEHEKLLGNTERTWTLFVDGYGKDGKRIYDSFQGKTCHQCRQKTLGYRTCCCKCNMVQGQFCGDCLYMRYGEHVLEALENPDWICPPCRGICNCSLCRQAKGWAPTGMLYKKISNLGYKSVAHYLVQTRRAEIIEVDKDADASNPVSAKRSLPFSDVTKSHEVNDLDLPLKKKKKPLKAQAETSNNGDEVLAKRSLLFSDEKGQLAKVEGSDTVKPLQLENVECSDTMKPLASSTKPCTDGIAGRLRSRTKKL
ncbi:uncharacterized protein LOC130740792 [Lotus japonicus]|uniref:uncharacterized protein LOC130740792 n=1 Tax=Lotus japonicus TaxID=34305 RepID=UPI00258D5213|nr:uncharacterized protein LOC130740792 [Lotus japonicus]